MRNITHLDVIMKIIKAFKDYCNHISFFCIIIICSFVTQINKRNDNKILSML